MRSQRFFKSLKSKELLHPLCSSDGSYNETLPDFDSLCDTLLKARSAKEESEEVKIFFEKLIQLKTDGTFRYPSHGWVALANLCKLLKHNPQTNKYIDCIVDFFNRSFKDKVYATQVYASTAPIPAIVFIPSDVLTKRLLAVIVRDNQKKAIISRKLEMRPVVIP